ncbi:tyrosine-type recombinase/integrase [Chloroflexota bacterium]
MKGLLYCQQILRNYIDNVRPVPQKDEYDALFLTGTGKPITSNTIKLLFHRLAKASGIGRLHAHLCGHTFAVNYIMNGGDVSSLKEIPGHTTFEVVNHYLHFTRSQITAQHRKYSPMDRLHLHK